MVLLSVWPTVSPGSLQPLALSTPSPMMLPNPTGEQYDRDGPFMAEYATDTYSLHLDQL